MDGYRIVCILRESTKKTHCEASVARNNTKRKRCNERESGGKKFKMGVVM